MTEQKYATASSGANIVEDSAVAPSTNPGANAPIVYPQWLKAALKADFVEDLSQEDEVEMYRQSIQKWYLAYLRNPHYSPNNTQDSQEYRYEALSTFLSTVATALRNQRDEEFVQHRNEFASGVLGDLENILRRYRQESESRAEEVFKATIAEQGTLLAQLQDENRQLRQLLSQGDTRKAVVSNDTVSRQNMSNFGRIALNVSTYPRNAEGQSALSDLMHHLIEGCNSMQENMQNRIDDLSASEPENIDLIKDDLSCLFSTYSSYAGVLESLIYFTSRRLSILSHPESQTPDQLQSTSTPQTPNTDERPDSNQ